MFKRTWKNYVFYVKCNDNPLLLVSKKCYNIGGPYGQTKIYQLS